MKFNTREDIDAPIDEVYRMLTDFDSFERSAMRRGADVKRLDSLDRRGVGMKWDIAFDLRGKRRQMVAELTRLEEPVALYFTSTSPGLGGVLNLDLLSLSRNRTRMSVALELFPRSLSARLMVQSLKLARTNLTRKFHLRVADFAKDIEDRYRSMA